MSDTPETDAFIGEGNDGSFMTEGEIAMCEFTRKLERERNLARERGFESADVIERLERENTALRVALKVASSALADFVEHIGECSERDLLRCDSDPHPPSVFSVYASQAKAVLAKLQPLLPTK